jgi:hypothetical protein
MAITVPNTEFGLGMIASCHDRTLYQGFRLFAASSASPGPSAR